jgi:predicted nucleic acid-binding Zn ribbon protein
VSRRAPRPLSQALTRFTDELAPDGTLARVQRAWEGVVGPAVAGACRPTGERDGVLTVSCAESVWAQELQLMGEGVVERLNATLGAPLLKRLKSRVG